jgi:hypothetical protein
MFTAQSNQLNTALQQSGIPPSAADAIVQSIANCAATLQHRGPVSFEYVPQNSRLVTPEDMKATTQSLGDFEISDGERRPFRPPVIDPPDEVDPPLNGPPPYSPPEPFDPTELWQSINRLEAQLTSLSAEVRANRQVIGANQAAIRYILNELQNTTECPEGASSPLIPEGALGPGIGGLG